MGRSIIITTHKMCETPTNRNNGICRILFFKYPKRAETIILRFENYIGLPLEPKNVNVENLIKFKTLIQKDLSPNSSATSCAWLSSAIRVYFEDKRQNPEPLCNALLVHREKGIFASVNQEEMDILESYFNTCENKIYRSVIALALLEFYTGARNSDTDGFTSSNIVNGTYIDKATGETRTRLVISYSSEKTSIKANIPVKPIVQDILFDDTLNDYIVDNSKFNRWIKVIFKELGLNRLVFEHRAGKDFQNRRLYEAVTSHSFRRSFATTLNDKGVDIEMISRMMGHTNTQQTRGYICGQNLVLDEEAMSFFD